jgi:cytochrome c oxidase subunit 2
MRLGTCFNRLSFREWGFGVFLAGCLIGAAGALSIAAFAEAPAREQPDVDRTINIVAERFTFVPSVVKLKYGETVELRLRSLDTNHGFAIPEAGVNVIVPKRGGGEARILFRANERGEFPFVCSKACGAGHTMMRGRIVVE